MYSCNVGDGRVARRCHLSQGSSSGCYPRKKGKQRESMRQELFRRSTQLRGKCKSGKARSDTSRIPPRAPWSHMPQSLGRELIAGMAALDLNDDPMQII